MSKLCKQERDSVLTWLPLRCCHLFVALVLWEKHWSWHRLDENAQTLEARARRKFTLAMTEPRSKIMYKYRIPITSTSAFICCFLSNALLVIKTESYPCSQGIAQHVDRVQQGRRVGLCAKVIVTVRRDMWESLDPVAFIIIYSLNFLATNMNRKVVTMVPESQPYPKTNQKQDCEQVTNFLSLCFLVDFRKISL